MKQEFYQISASQIPIYFLEKDHCGYAHEEDYLEEMKNFSVARKQEFLKGRYLAEHMLFDDSKIGKDQHGAPIFPGATKGSIAHSDKYVCVSTSEEVEGIGIDVEEVFTDTIYNETKDRLFTKAEQELIECYSEPLVVATLLFSAKESFYKCYHQDYLRFIDFLEIDVYQLCFEKHQFSLRFQGLSYEGYFHSTPHAVFTQIFKN